jgi:3-oxoacyl-[acyl-carrier-protein] synthase-3
MSYFNLEDKGIYFNSPEIALPSRHITNESLIDLMNLKLKPSWIEKRTGIQSRYWANKDEACSDLAITSAKKLITKRNISKDNIGILALSTISGDYLSPPTSPLIQNALELSYDVGCLDIGAACSGFVTGLINSSLMTLAQEKDILFIASDIRSKFLDHKDFQTSILFGDGAASTIITKNKEKAEYQLIGAEMLSDGSVADIISIPSGGSRKPFEDETSEKYLKMKSGSELFIKATNGMHESAVNLLEKLNLKMEDIDWIVPHQANLHMIHLIAQRLDYPLERISQTIKKWGNTSGASVGMALSEVINKPEVKNGSNILLISAGGGGLTANAVIRKL